MAEFRSFDDKVIVWFRLVRWGPAPIADIDPEIVRDPPAPFAFCVSFGLSSVHCYALTAEQFDAWNPIIPPAIRDGETYWVLLKMGREDRWTPGWDETEPELLVSAVRGQQIVPADRASAFRDGERSRKTED